MSALNLHGVVFDADGTLFDTERLAQRVWLGMARDMGAPAIEEHYLELIGRNREGIITLLRQVTGPDFPLDDFLAACAQRTRAQLEEVGVPVKEGAREILEFLHRREIPIALATSSGGPTTQLKLERTGLLDYFQVVVTGDMVSRGKPDPEIYLTACQKLGVEPAQAMAVEDSPNGIRSAHAAGIPTAMVLDLLPPTPELETLCLGKFESLLSLRDYLAQNLYNSLT